MVCMYEVQVSIPRISNYCLFQREGHEKQYCMSLPIEKHLPNA